MGTLSAGLVAGTYYPAYDAYYQKLDPNNEGRIGAVEAARFLKTSGLSDVVLSKIWDLADSNGKGYLTKSGLFVALKLVALIQAGKEAVSTNLSLDIPPPRMGDADPIAASKSTGNGVASADIDWTIKCEEKINYDRLFDSLNSVDGFINGNDVKGLLLDSKLPLDTLGKIWDLADIDKDGALNRHEFSVAMHLVYKALEKYAIPARLPPELLPPGTKKDASHLPDAIAILPAVSGDGLQPVAASISAAADIVSPSVTKPPTSSSLAQNVYDSGGLAAIAPTYDRTAPPLKSSPPSPLSGVVSSPQPSSAINAVPLMPQPTGGLLSPTTSIANRSSQDLSAASSAANEMLPSLSSSASENWVITDEELIKFDSLFEQADLDKDGFVSGYEIKDTFLKSGVAQPVLAHVWSLCDTGELGKLNKEQFALALWLISRKLKGIEPPLRLTPEMIPPSCRKTNSEISCNDSVVFASPEVDTLSKEIDDLMKEKLVLETDITQREADIKIKSSELKTLQSEFEALSATLKQLENQKGEAMKRINDLKTQVAKLRQQTEEQEKQLKYQEAELGKRKQELKSLKDEEISSKKELDNFRTRVDNVSKISIEAAEVVDEIQTKLVELDDFRAHLNEAISHLDTVLESKNVTSLSEVYLGLEPKFEYKSFDSLIDRASEVIDANDSDADRISKICSRAGADDANFSSADSSTVVDPFAQQDSLTSHDGVTDAASKSVFPIDPFASFETTNTIRKADPFADSCNSSKSNTSQRQNDDPFGCDPFAILHAPSKSSGDNQTSPSSAIGSRPESPSPALPPKKCKQPPPRPAPPRPAPPLLPSGFDADFADFSNFSRKALDATGSITSISNRSYPSQWKTSQKDPFRDYRYEDPFEVADNAEITRGASAPPLTDDKESWAFEPVPAKSTRSSVKTSTSNGLPKSVSSTEISFPPSEDRQLAWAATESVTSEKERRKRAEQEKADYKLAVKLSKAEGKKRSFKSKILL